MLNSFFEKLSDSIQKKGEISPFLFLSHNLEVFHSELRSEIFGLLTKHGIDRQSVFTLEDSPENLKIGEVKKFLTQGDIRPRFAFQIFVIENISRMTIQAQNACLKFFEEPWVGNIIFLTDSSESWILETILSRVQVQDLRKNTSIAKNHFFISMIETHVSGASDELVRYFFSWKYEKQEYVEFLSSLVHYISDTWSFIKTLDELEEDIGWILKNNLQGKYIVDKYIMKLGA